jgi:hypothetical protein
MQSDRAAKRDNRGDAANTMKHDAKALIERRHQVNCRTRRRESEYRIAYLFGTKTPLPSSR